ncbi:MAG: hypothetical protein GC161_16110 [Planctomycetaceae bacterium]|nr:hypothetical protein [Planctomycetaceae bacterium]
MFEDLVFRLLERREQAGEVVLDEFCAENPAWAERLRARVGELHAGGLLEGGPDDVPPGAWREVDLVPEK